MSFWHGIFVMTYSAPLISSWWHLCDSSILVDMNMMHLTNLVIWATYDSHFPLRLKVTYRIYADSWRLFMTSSWMTTSCTLKLVMVYDCIWYSSESQTRSFFLQKYVKSSHLCCIYLDENSLTFASSCLFSLYSNIALRGSVGMYNALL